VIIAATLSFLNIKNNMFNKSIENVKIKIEKVV
jgi:hypothetical protein